MSIIISQTLITPYLLYYFLNKEGCEEINKEKEIKSNLKKIINNFEKSINESIFIFSDNPIVLDELLKKITDFLVFLYKEENKTPYIEIKYFDFSLGTFKVGEPKQLYNGQAVIEGFISNPENSYAVAKQIAEKMLDNLFTIINLHRTNI